MIVVYCKEDLETNEQTKSLKGLYKYIYIIYIYVYYPNHKISSGIKQVQNTLYNLTAYQDIKKRIQAGYEEKFLH